jgi:phage terminase large subunit-like protein
MNLSERQRKRFMFGEWVEEVEGALWKSSLIDRTRLLRMSVKSVCTVIGVDPAVSSNNSSDYTGIVVCSLGDDGHFYVTGDFSMQGKPVEWCRKIVEIFHKFQASAVIAEVNNGGELIENLLHTFDSYIPVKSVRAFDSKIRRAELVAALYEQLKVHHTGRFAELEDEMCSYNPATSNKSPDRMDALVWAIRFLLEKNTGRRFVMA